MKTIHVVAVIVVLSLAVFGAAMYWRTFAGILLGPSAQTFTITIDSDTRWSGTVGGSITGERFGSAKFTIHYSTASASLQKQTEGGYLTITILKDGQIVDTQTTNEAFGVVAVYASS